MSAQTDVRTAIYPGTLYDYTAGVYCGVLVTERVMRKLVGLQYKHLEEVRRLLGDSAGDVFPSMWTLHHPSGVQTVVRYIDKSSNVADSIKHATTAHGPRIEPLVFEASSMDEAKSMADARIAAMESTP